MKSKSSEEETKSRQESTHRSNRQSAVSSKSQGKLVYSDPTNKNVSAHAIKEKSE